MAIKSTAPSKKKKKKKKFSVKIKLRRDLSCHCVCIYLKCIHIKYIEGGLLESFEILNYYPEL